MQKVYAFLMPVAAAVLLPAMFLLAQPPGPEKPPVDDLPARPLQPGHNSADRNMRTDRPGNVPFSPPDRLTGVRTQIGATEEEWQVIGPLMQQVVATRRSLQPESANRGGGMFGGFFGSGRPGGRSGVPGRESGGDGNSGGSDADANRPPGRSFNGPGGFPGGGFGGAFGPPRGENPPRSDAPLPPPGGFGGGPFGNNPVAQAQNQLKLALAAEKTSAEELAAKIAAVRKAREEAQQKLVESQEELKLLLTPRQEAILVSEGYLD